LLSPQRKARWLANMQAAGVEPDEVTLERVEAGIAERLGDLDRLLERYDVHSNNPDFLRPWMEKESGDERS
jgi:hypothetical protein